MKKKLIYYQSDHIISHRYSLVYYKSLSNENNDTIYDEDNFLSEINFYV